MMLWSWWYSTFLSSQPLYMCIQIFRLPAKLMKEGLRMVDQKLELSYRGLTGQISSNHHNNNILFPLVI